MSLISRAADEYEVTVLVVVTFDAEDVYKGNELII
jgi:hypothetical protein